MSESLSTRLGLTSPDAGTGEPIDIEDHLESNWNKIDAVIGFTVCTNATRPATPFQGQPIYETDTRRAFIWNSGSAVWEQIFLASPAGAIAVAGTGSTATLRLYTTSSASGHRAIAFRGTGDTQDRHIHDYDGAMQWGSGSAGADVSISRTSAGVLEVGAGRLEGHGLSRVAVKTVDTTRNNTATLSADPELIFTSMPANSTWIMKGWLRWLCSSGTPDIKIAFSGPSGATVERSFFAQPVANTTFDGTITTSAEGTLTNAQPRASVNGANAGMVMGTVHIAGTAGTVSLTWAQNTATAVDLDLLSGSWIELTRVD